MLKLKITRATDGSRHTPEQYNAASAGPAEPPERYSEPGIAAAMQHAVYETTAPAIPPQAWRR